MRILEVGNLVIAAYFFFNIFCGLCNVLLFWIVRVIPERSFKFASSFFLKLHFVVLLGVLFFYKQFST